ncbi:hypothetical protein [Nocardia sp. NBC_01327]|uniref:hypothetical protein n=1 Tax=Nocardia sp. NBC_01327 TaxID=2903593 RepID=UPI002E115375|nr:hypothetical protein OG326_40730 [Nocardia sp. NBC_01327]
MTERIDAVPEADYVEQHTAAFPSDSADPEPYPDRDASADLLDSDSEITQPPSGDSGWTADEADLIEQSIPVPLGEEYDASGSSDTEY